MNHGFPFSSFQIFALMSLRKKSPKMWPKPFFAKMYTKTDLRKKVAQNFGYFRTFSKNAQRKQSPNTYVGKNSPNLVTLFAI
jgi:hypothetical protein